MPKIPRKLVGNCREILEKILAGSKQPSFSVIPLISLCRLRDEKMCESVFVAMGLVFAKVSLFR